MIVKRVCIFCMGRGCGWGVFFVWMLFLDALFIFLYFILTLFLLYLLYSNEGFINLYIFL